MIQSPSFPAPNALRRAFTLIELLVVIAIIAILAAILFPVFAQAKGAAKGAVCLGNIKNISLAWVMYAGDYDDTPALFPAGYSSGAIAGCDYGDAVNLWEDACTVNGEWVHDTSKGLLQPYLRSGAIVNCPAATLDPSESQAPNLAYSLNANLYFGYTDEDDVKAAGLGEGGSLSGLQSPAETIFMSDSAAGTPPYHTSAYATGCGTSYVGYLGYVAVGSGGFTEGRHNGNANVGWADGHAKSKKPSLGPFPIEKYGKPDGSDGMSPSFINAYHPGLILYGAWKGASSSEYATSVHDCYYYTASKPE